MALKEFESDVTFLQNHLRDAVLDDRNGAIVSPVEGQIRHLNGHMETWSGGGWHPAGRINATEFVTEEWTFSKGITVQALDGPRATHIGVWEAGPYGDGQPLRSITAVGLQEILVPGLSTLTAPHLPYWEGTRLLDSGFTQEPANDGVDVLKADRPIHLEMDGLRARWSSWAGFGEMHSMSRWDEGYQDYANMWAWWDGGAGTDTTYWRFIISDTLQLNTLTDYGPDNYGRFLFRTDTNHAIYGVSLAKLKTEIFAGFTTTNPYIPYATGPGTFGNSPLFYTADNIYFKPPGAEGSGIILEGSSGTTGNESKMSTTSTYQFDLSVRANAGAGWTSALRRTTNLWDIASDIKLNLLAADSAMAASDRLLYWRVSDGKMVPRSLTNFKATELAAYVTSTGLTTGKIPKASAVRALVDSSLTETATNLTTTLPFQSPQIGGAPGTVNVPGYIFTGYRDKTGFYSPSRDQICFRLDNGLDDGSQHTFCVGPDKIYTDMVIQAPNLNINGRAFVDRSTTLKTLTATEQTLFTISTPAYHANTQYYGEVELDEIATTASTLTLRVKRDGTVVHTQTYNLNTASTETYAAFEVSPGVNTPITWTVTGQLNTGTAAVDGTASPSSFTLLAFSPPFGVDTGGGSGLTGSGTQNRLALWTSATNLTSSVMREVAGKIGINSDPVSTEAFQVFGAGRFSGSLMVGTASNTSALPVFVSNGGVLEEQPLASLKTNLGFVIGDLQMASSRLLGRTTTGTGPTEQITVSSDFIFASQNLAIDWTKGYSTYDLRYVVPGQLPVGAIPTKKVNLGPIVAGSATTFIRSDAQLELDQLISPQWGAQHTFYPEPPATQSSTGVAFKTSKTAPSPSISIQYTGLLLWANDTWLSRSAAGVLSVNEGVSTTGGFTSPNISTFAPLASAWTHIPVWDADPTPSDVDPRKQIKHRTKAQFITDLAVVPTTRTLTLTGGGIITVTPSTAQDLSANRSWTISATVTPPDLSGLVPKTTTLQHSSTTGDLTVSPATAQDLTTSRQWSYTVNSAPKWTTARTISLTGAVTGSTSIDGSANVSIATTLTSFLSGTAGRMTRWATASTLDANNWDVTDTSRWRMRYVADPVTVGVINEVSSTDTQISTTWGSGLYTPSTNQAFPFLGRNIRMTGTATTDAWARANALQPGAMLSIRSAGLDFSMNLSASSATGTLDTVLNQTLFSVATVAGQEGNVFVFKYLQSKAATLGTLDDNSRIVVMSADASSAVQYYQQTDKTTFANWMRPTLQHDLDAHSDVTISTPVQGNYLIYDGTQWRNTTPDLTHKHPVQDVTTTTKVRLYGQWDASVAGAGPYLGQQIALDATLAMPSGTLGVVWAQGYPTYDARYIKTGGAPTAHTHPINEVTSRLTYANLDPILFGATQTGTGVPGTEIELASTQLSITGNTLGVLSAPRWTNGVLLTLTNDASGGTTLIGNETTNSIGVTVNWTNGKTTYDGYYEPKRAAGAASKFWAWDQSWKDIIPGYVVFTGAKKILGVTSAGAGKELSISTTLDITTDILSVLSAPKWTTARTITLGTDLSGSVSIDGSAGVTLNATVVWANGYTAYDSRYVQPTTLSNYVPTTRTLTLVGAGTVSVSPTGAQDLSLNRSWTITGATTDLSALVTKSTTLTIAGTGGITVTPNTAQDLSASRSWSISGNFEPPIAAGTASKFWSWNKTWQDIDWAYITNKPTTFTPATHTHPYTDINNVTTARLLGRTTAGTGATELITLGSGLQFSGSTLQINPLQAAPIEWISGSIAAGQDTWRWVRIALLPPLTYNNVSGGGRASARFMFRSSGSGVHERVNFYAGSHYGRQPTLVLESMNAYSGQYIRKIRLVEATTYDGAAVDIEIRGLVGSACSLYLHMHEDYENPGWTLQAFVDPADVPANFTTYELDLTAAAEADVPVIAVSTDANQSAFKVSRRGGITGYSLALSNDLTVAGNASITGTVTSVGNGKFNNVGIGATSPYYGVEVIANPTTYDAGWARMTNFANQGTNNLWGSGQFGAYGQGSLINYAYIGVYKDNAAPGTVSYAGFPRYSFYPSGTLRAQMTASNYGEFVMGTITSGRTWTMPDATGTVALTSDIATALTSYVPTSRSLTINAGSGISVSPTGAQALTGDIAWTITNTATPFPANGVTGAGSANRMPRWTSATNLDYTSFDLSDTTPTKMKYLLSPTGAVQWEIASGTTGLCVTMGGRYSGGNAFLAANARQTTNSADVWEMPYQNAAAGACIVSTYSTAAASDVFSVRWAAPLATAGAYTTFFSVPLFWSDAAGNCTVGRYLTLKAATSVIETRVLSLDADASSTAQVVRQTTLTELLGGTGGGRTALTSTRIPYWTGTGFADSPLKHTTANYVDITPVTAGTNTSVRFSSRSGVATHVQMDLGYQSLNGQHTLFCPLWGCPVSAYESTIDGGANWTTDTPSGSISEFCRGEYDNINNTTPIFINGNTGKNGCRVTVDFTNRLTIVGLAWYFSGGLSNLNIRVEVKKAGVWSDAIAKVNVGGTAWPGYNSYHPASSYDSATVCEQVRLSFTWDLDAAKQFTGTAFWLYGTYQWSSGYKLFWSDSTKQLITRNIACQNVFMWATKSTIPTAANILFVADDATSVSRTVYGANRQDFYNWLAPVIPVITNYVTTDTSQTITGDKTWDNATGTTKLIKTAVSGVEKFSVTADGTITTAASIFTPAPASVANSGTFILTTQGPQNTANQIQSMDQATFRTWVNPGWPTGSSAFVNRYAKWTASNVLSYGEMGDDGVGAFSNLPLDVTGRITSTSALIRPNVTSGWARRFIAHGATYNAAATVTGNMLFKLPITIVNGTQTMARFTVKIYNYASGEMDTEVEVTGYVYYQSATQIYWVNPKALVRSSQTRIAEVKVGYDKTDSPSKFCFCIKPTGGTWAYPNVQMDAYVGYTGGTHSAWLTTATAISFVDDTYYSTNIKSMQTASVEGDQLVTPIHTFDTSAIFQIKSAGSQFQNVAIGINSDSSPAYGVTATITTAGTIGRGFRIRGLNAGAYSVTGFGASFTGATCNYAAINLLSNVTPQATADADTTFALPRFIFFPSGNFQFDKSTGPSVYGVLAMGGVTTNRTWTMPDKTGTVALTSDIVTGGNISGTGVIGTLAMFDPSTTAIKDSNLSQTGNTPNRTMKFIDPPPTMISTTPPSHLFGRTATDGTIFQIDKSNLITWLGIGGGGIAFPGTQVAYVADSGGWQALGLAAPLQYQASSRYTIEIQTNYYALFSHRHAPAHLDFQNTKRLAGSGDTGLAPISGAEISLGSGLDMAGTTLYCTLTQGLTYSGTWTAGVIPKLGTVGSNQLVPSILSDVGTGQVDCAGKLSVTSTFTAGNGMVLNGAANNFGTLRYLLGQPTADNSVGTYDAAKIKQWLAIAISDVTNLTTTLAGKADNTISLTGTTNMSITGGGNLTANRTFNLVGDSTAPGNSKYYGTNSSGTRGWYDLPSGGGGGITGSGTTNYIPKWSSSTALTNSSISEGVGQVSIAANLACYGNITTDNNITSNGGYFLGPYAQIDNIYYPDARGGAFRSRLPTLPDDGSTTTFYMLVGAGGASYAYSKVPGPPTANQVLSYDGAALKWATVSGGGGIGEPPGTATVGSVWVRVCTSTAPLTFIWKELVGQNIWN